MIGWYLAGGILGFLLLTLLLFLFLIAPRPRRKRPDDAPFRGKEFAHRGLHGATVPENSLRAFGERWNGIWASSWTFSSPGTVK